MSGGPDPAEDEDEAALRWAQAESLKQTQDAGLPDAMLESELRQAARLSLRQGQADAERLRQQEEEELERAMQASLQSAPPPRAAAPPAAQAVAAQVVPLVQASPVSPPPPTPQRPPGPAAAAEPEPRGARRLPMEPRTKPEPEYQQNYG